MTEIKAVPDPILHTYVCEKGHEQTEVSSPMIIHSVVKPELNGDYCLTCWLEFVHRNVSRTTIKPV